MLALITGASSGIGLMYARELASQGHDLIIVSNQEKELEEVRAQLIEQYGVKVWSVYKDLTYEHAAEELHDYCLEQNLEVDILINNAGVFFFNFLNDTSLKRIELMLKLHVLNTVRMTRIFGEDMQKRNTYVEEIMDENGEKQLLTHIKPKQDQRPGYILNMSSMSAWMAMPGIQCYNATKAFINNFSHSMWYELHPYGVNLLSVTPGAVDTGLYGLSMPLRRLAVAIRVSIPPEKLVKKAIKALFKGKKNCMPGFVNHIAVPFLKHLPDWLINFAIRHLAQFMK